MSGFCTFSALGRYGRFANQIYQIAGTIGIARKNGMEPVFPVWRNYDHAERFGSGEDINAFEHFRNPLPGPVDAEVHGAFKPRPVEWGYHNVILPPGNWDISGHLQSLKYFDHCLDEVRHFMSMWQEPKITQPYTAIHARRGDYDDKYHPRIPTEWYVKAIQHFSAEQRFLVFSDDPCFISQFSDALTIHGLGAYANNMIQYRGDYLSSFALMKKCEHFIIGNSSYSAAAATLAEAKDKQVIAPRTWFGAAYAGSITGDDVYCPGWKVM
jgi:hypothetical protein